jgi:aldehyde dehydrogenase (NAD+)
MEIATLLARLGVTVPSLGLDGQSAPLPAAGSASLIGASGEVRASLNPATDEHLADVKLAARSDVEPLVAAARARFESFRRVPAPKRGEIVRRLGELFREHKRDLGALITLEVGKIRSEGEGEVQEMIDICEFAVGLSRQLHGLTIASERDQHRMMEQWHPLGPIGVITAFNFPMAVWAWNAALATVAGDTTIWKPSEHAPLCALAVHGLCQRVMREFELDGLFTLVAGGADVGAELAQHRALPLVSFTGSVRAGRKVAAVVAERLGRSLLELGGNNAVIVLADADLDLAVRAITFGAVGTAGQRCTTTRRVFVEEPARAELEARLVAAFRSVPIGDPREESTLLGPLIHDDAVRAFCAAIEEARRQGGEIVTGGRVVRGRFVEPTLVRAPSQASLPIAFEETFAPILYLFPTSSLADAIAANNAVSQGLSSALFSDSLRSAETFLSAWGSDCGIANVNLGTSGAEIGGAFGGEKDTGGGRESGSDAWKAYMRRQTSTVNFGRTLPLAQGVKFT